MPETQPSIGERIAPGMYRQDASGVSQFNFDKLSYILGGMGAAIAEDPSSWQAQLGRMSQGMAEAEELKRTGEANLKRTEAMKAAELDMIIKAMSGVKGAGEGSSLTFKDGGLSVKLNPLSETQIGQYLQQSKLGSLGGMGDFGSLRDTRPDAVGAALSGEEV